MGWLRDLMLTSDPALPSFGKLAEAALDHEGWPDDTRPKPRSLSALFSKLDRGQDLDWLRDRPAVQRVLAEVMNRPLGDFEMVLVPPRAGATERVLRLDDLRYARELDVRDEDPPPGLPALLEPAKWGLRYWHAPSGSGRSLLGRYLTVRGLATHVEVGGPLAEVTVPPRGPLYIELHRRADCEQVSAWLETWGVDRRPICVAGPALPRDPRWSIVESPQLDTYLEDLAAWVEARLGADGHFEPSRAVAWIRRVARPAGAAATWGDVLGWLGLQDELSSRSFQGRTLSDLASTFVHARITEYVETSSLSSWLKRHAFDSLLGMATRLLTESDDDWTVPRTFDEWLSLIPPEHQRGVDADWMRRAFAGGPDRLRQADVAAATKRLPPGAFALVRAFETARLLRVEPDGRLRLAPHWLGQTLVNEAREKIVEISPFEWGEALLRPAHRAGVIRALHARARQGRWAPLFAAVDLTSPENPAHVAALEASAVVAGLSVLAGRGAPEELEATLAETQNELAMHFRDAPPLPRLPHGEDLRSLEEPLLCPAAWTLARLSLSERHGRFGARPTAHELSQLNTFFAELSQSEPPDAAERSSFETHDWILPAFELLDRWFHSNTEDGSPSSPTVRALPLLAPSQLLTKVEHGQATLEDFRALDEAPWGPRIVEKLLEWRRMPVDGLASAFWRVAHDVTDLPRFVAEAERRHLGAKLWEQAPTPTLVRRLETRRAVESRHLLPHQFAALRSSAVPWSRELATHAPVDLCIEVMTSRDRLGSEEAFLALWSRAARELVSLLERALEERRLDLAERLYLTAPESHHEQVLGILENRGSAMTFPKESLDRLRRFLWELVGRRAESWRTAHSLLAAIEESLLIAGVR